MIHFSNLIVLVYQKASKLYIITIYKQYGL
jgi:hypothetical protein